VGHTLGGLHSLKMVPTASSLTHRFLKEGRLPEHRGHYSPTTAPAFGGGRGQTAGWPSPEANGVRLSHTGERPWPG